MLAAYRRRGADPRIYAGKVFTAGMGIRLASLGSASSALPSWRAARSRWSKPEAAAAGAGSGAALLILGGLGYWGGIIYDIATAGSAVDDYNQRLRLHVTPTVIPTASSGLAVGLGITGSF